MVVARATSDGGGCRWGCRGEGAEEDSVGPMKHHVDFVRAFEFNHPREHCQALKKGGKTRIVRGIVGAVWSVPPL